MEDDQGHRQVPAKMTPPGAENIYLRAATREAIEAGRRRRLTLVCAPAGYGKTTTIAASHAQAKRKPIWCRLDALDRDPVQFLSSLTDAFRRAYPGFGEAVRGRLNLAHESPRVLEQLLAAFSTECRSSLVPETYVVIDDYHEVSGSPDIDRLMDFFIRSLPEYLHFTVISRYNPSISIYKLKLEDQLIFVGTDVLRFDNSQVSSIMKDETGTVFPNNQIDQIVRYTAGWPAAVVLTIQALKWIEFDSLSDALSNPRMKNDIYSYLAEQVYNNELPETRYFLDMTCCLSSMTEKSVRAVTDINDVHRHINYLLDNRVFVYEGDDRKVRYHTLFRDFLRQHYLRAHGEERLRALQIVSAGALEHIGETDMAVELLLDANEPRAALEVIARSGQLGLDNLSTDSLEAWLRRLPWLLRTEHPWAHLASAQVHIRAGRLREANSDVDRAADACDAIGDEWGLYHALSARECVLFWQGDTEAAMKTCEQALAHAQTDTQRFHTLLSMGAAAVDARDWEGSRSAFTASQTYVAEAPLHERVRAHALQSLEAYLRGDYVLADSLCAHSLPELESPMLSAGVLNVMGLIAMGLAQYGTALTRLNKAKQIADRCGLTLTARMIEDNSALLLGATGRLEEGLEAVRRTLETVSECSADPVLSAYGHGAEATILRRCGRQSDAIQSYLKASQLVSVNRDPCVALELSANLAFTKALAADGDGRELPAIAVDASRSGLSLVSLAANLYTAILLAPSDQKLAAEIMSKTIPEQLRLGHIDLLAQELCFQPASAALALASVQSRHLQLTLLATLAQHWRFASVFAVLVDQESELLAQALDAVRSSNTGIMGPVLALAMQAKRTPTLDTAVSAALEHPKPRRSGAGDDTPDRFLSLSKRETDVLRLMASGMRNPEIASALFVSTTTIKTHINHIFSKLGVSSRVEAVLRYRER